MCNNGRDSRFIMESDIMNIERLEDKLTEITADNITEEEEEWILKWANRDPNNIKDSVPDWNVDKWKQYINTMQTKANELGL